MKTIARPEAKPRQLYSIPHAAQVIDRSPRSIYAMIQAGELEAVRVGSRTTRITGESIERYIASLPKISEQPVITPSRRGRRTGARRAP